MPDFYDDLHRRLSRQGARVLALGYKKFGNLSPREVRSHGSLIKLVVITVTIVT